jgi:hypothetical protein
MNATNKNARKVKRHRSWRTSNLRKLPSQAKGLHIRLRGY